MPRGSNQVSDLVCWPWRLLPSSSWSLVVSWWVLPTHTTTVSLRVHGSALLGPLLTIWCCFGGYYPGLSRLPVPFPVVLRFYEPPISTEEQLALPTGHAEEQKIEDPRTPSVRTPGGPHEDPTRTP